MGLSVNPSVTVDDANLERSIFGVKSNRISVWFEKKQNHQSNHQCSQTETTKFRNGKILTPSLYKHYQQRSQYEPRLIIAPISCRRFSNL